MFGLSTKAFSALAGSLLLVGVVIGAAAVMADGDDFGTVEAPEWKAGYAWTYDVSGEMSYNVQVPGEVSESNSFAIPTLKLQKEILNTEDFTNEGEPLYIGAATLPLSHILDGSMFGLGSYGDLVRWPTADRQRDLAPVLVYPDWEHDGGAQPEMTGLEFGPDTPIDYIRFPLEAGKRWSDSVDFGAGVVPDSELDALDGIAEIKMVAEVGSMERVLLPVGATDAVRMDFNYHPSGLQKALAEFREEAESYGATVERLNVQIGLHEIVHYSPEYQAVVRDQYVMKVLIDALFSFNGDSFEIYGEMSGYVVSELTGATLSEVPEYSTRGILDKLNGIEPIADAEGAIVDEDSLYRVGVTLADDRINAANGEPVSILTSVDGDGLPAGHKLAYFIVDADGMLVAEGAASRAFNYAPEEPGIYTVFLQGLDEENRLISEDRAVFYADYVATFTEQCGAADTFVYSDCGDIAIPMRTGLEHAVFEARFNNTVPILGQDRLELYNAADERVATAYGDGIYRIEIEGSGAGVSREDGMLQFVPSVAMGETVSYTVALTYGAGAIDHVTYEDDAGMMALMQDPALMVPMLQMVDDALVSAVSQESVDGDLLALF